ncbi:MAG: hypothetical protein WC511_02975 [Candidatus Pacearchaeota archaeon]
MSIFKNLTQLAEALEINPQDLFMIVQSATNLSKKITFETISQALTIDVTSTDVDNLSTVSGATVTEALNNIQAGITMPAEMVDIQHRFSEFSAYTINRDPDGFVGSIVAPLFGGVDKTWSFTRDINGMVQTINIHKSDNSYDKTYTFNRTTDGFVTSVVIS